MEKIIQYKTEDGLVFNTKKEVEEHEQNQKIFTFLRERFNHKDHYENDEEFCSCFNEIFKFIMENKKEILQILNDFEKGKILNVWHGKKGGAFFDYEVSNFIPIDVYTIVKDQYLNLTKDIDLSDNQAQMLLTNVPDYRQGELLDGLPPIHLWKSIVKTQEFYEEEILYCHFGYCY